MNETYKTEDLIRLVKEGIEKSGKTDREIAESAGIFKGTVTKIRNGDGKSAQPRILNKIIVALNIEI